MSQPCAPATLYMLALFGAGAGVLGLGTADPAPPVEAVSLDAPAHLAALEAPPAEAAFDVQSARRVGKGPRNCLALQGDQLVEQAELIE